MLRRTFCLTLIFVFACSASADLVGYWSFDEGAGTVANDGSGNNNHGDVMGGAQWVAGKMGGALAFDGADDMVVVNQASGLPLYYNNAFSIADIVALCTMDFAAKLNGLPHSSEQQNLDRWHQAVSGRPSAKA